MFAKVVIFCSALAAAHASLAGPLGLGAPVLAAGPLGYGKGLIAALQSQRVSAKERHQPCRPPAPDCCPASWICAVHCWWTSSRCRTFGLWKRTDRFAPSALASVTQRTAINHVAPSALSWICALLCRLPSLIRCKPSASLAIRSRAGNGISLTDSSPDTVWCSPPLGNGLSAHTMLGVGRWS
ncbi:hypothetical protein AVEN_58646-1 [Araneus ventricosus]|uniref:Uncharacterized protein n=1 Tax=Araneus ventricosus TaxID=182803 RepID=A0A4Y2T606_ARAVE|nr:hypothetical protein AVEN_58646-1 [Araneus ventricosus]